MEEIEEESLILTVTVSHVFLEVRKCLRYAPNKKMYLVIATSFTEVNMGEQFWPISEILSLNPTVEKWDSENRGSFWTDNVSLSSIPFHVILT